MSEVELIELEQQPAGVVRGRVASDGIADFLGGAFGEAMRESYPDGPDVAEPRTLVRLPCTRTADERAGRGG